MKDGGWAVPIGEVGVGLKLCRFIERPRPKCQCWVVMRVHLLLGFVYENILTKMRIHLLAEYKNPNKGLDSDFFIWA